MVYGLWYETRIIWIVITKKHSNFGALSFNIGKKERIMESGVNAGHGKVVVSFRY